MWPPDAPPPPRRPCCSPPPVCAFRQQALRAAVRRSDTATTARPTARVQVKKIDLELMPKFEEKELFK